MSEMIERMARALYDCEAERALNVERVLTAAKGSPVAGTMEPWEDVADVYRGDARRAFDAIVEAIGWPEIHAYQAELRKGQGIYEDAGGFFARAIAAIFGKKGDEVLTYQRAAEAMIADPNWRP